MPMNTNSEKSRGYRQPRHHDRKDLVGEHPFGDLGQIICLIIFLVVWITDSFWLNLTTWVAAYVPWYIRIIFEIPILILGFSLAFLSTQKVFHEIRDPPKVIQSGVYAHARHPMYFAALLFYCGCVVATLSIASLIVGVFIWIFYDIIARHEERLLENFYGKDYRDYKQTVPRWGFKLN